ncbi:hypothetical protein D9M73_106410 [compost metagenome]|jgi:hypothetical protein
MTCGLHGIDFSEDTSNVPHDRLSARREPHTGTVALEEGEAKLILKPCDTPTDRRRMQPEHERCTRKVSCIHRRRHKLEVGEVHFIRPRRDDPAN